MMQCTCDAANALEHAQRKIKSLESKLAQVSSSLENAKSKMKEFQEQIPKQLPLDSGYAIQVKSNHPTLVPGTYSRVNLCSAQGTAIRVQQQALREEKVTQQHECFRFFMQYNELIEHRKAQERDPRKVYRLCQTDMDFLQSLMPSYALEAFEQDHQGVKETRTGKFTKDPWQKRYSIPQVGRWFGLDTPDKTIQKQYLRWKQREAANRPHHTTLGNEDDRAVLKHKVEQALINRQSYSRLQVEEQLASRLTQRLEQHGPEALNFHETRYLATGQCMHRSTWRAISSFNDFATAACRPLAEARADDFTTFNCKQSLHALRTAMQALGILEESNRVAASRVWNMDETVSLKGASFLPHTVTMAGVKRGTDRIAPEKHPRQTLCGA
eukprot:m.310968 g.310968  ORF g.310968 m.310968 type:complete len:384 (-) comp15952_c0_seq6:2235-3386(-)